MTGETKGKSYGRSGRREQTAQLRNGRYGSGEMSGKRRRKEKRKEERRTEERG